MPANSEQDKENWKKKGKGTDEPELTMYAVLYAGQLLINFNPIPLLPISHIPPQSILIRANPGGGDNWAATLATSQVGTTNEGRGQLRILE